MDGMDSSSGREMRILCCLFGILKGSNHCGYLYLCIQRRIILNMGLRKKCEAMDCMHVVLNMATAEFH